MPSLWREVAPGAPNINPLCSYGGLALVAVSLTACQRIYVTSESAFSHVDVDCVDAAIKSVPGISGVTHTVGSSGIRNSATDRGEALTQSHQWTYHSKEPASISLTHDGRRWTLSLDVMTSAPPWTSEKLEALNPTMAHINEAISRDCDLPIARNTSVNWD